MAAQQSADPSYGAGVLSAKPRRPCRWLIRSRRSTQRWATTVPTILTARTRTQRTLSPRCVALLPTIPLLPRPQPSLLPLLLIAKVRHGHETGAGMGLSSALSLAPTRILAARQESEADSEDEARQQAESKRKRKIAKREEKVPTLPLLSRASPPLLVAGYVGSPAPWPV